MPVLARALGVADRTVLLAGPPEPNELRSNQLTLPNLDKAEAVFRGSQGAALCLVDAADGESLAQ